MIIVIDCNRVIAALIKESTTRQILLSKNFEFVAPEFIKSEIQKYGNLIVKKAGITGDEFDLLLSMIFDGISIVSRDEYGEFVKKLDGEIVDVKDIPYLAVYYLRNAEGIWTHDPHFLENKELSVLSNIDMLNVMNDNS